jgi:hypothetical protein
MERKRSGGGTKRKRADSEKGSGGASSKKSKRRIKPFSFALIPGEPEAALRARLLAAPAGAVRCCVVVCSGAVAAHYPCVLPFHQLKAVSQRYRISSKNKDGLAHNLANTIVRERFTQDAVFAYPPPAAAAAPAVPLVCHIARLSSAVLVHVSQFLVLHEVAALACTNRTNRTVATLRIDETGSSSGGGSSDGEVKASVSPCLLRRKHFAFYNRLWREGSSAACVSEETVRRLLSCTSELQSLELDMAAECDVFALFEAARASSERTLQSVSIVHPDTSDVKVVQTLFQCPNLRRLVWNAWGYLGLAGTASLAVRPSLVELESDLTTVMLLSSFLPALRQLTLYGMPTADWRWKIDRISARFPLLEELNAQLGEHDLHCLLAFPALRRASVNLRYPPLSGHWTPL